MEPRHEVPSETAGTSQEAKTRQTNPALGEAPGPELRTPPVESVRERPRDGRRIAVVGEDIYEMGPDGKPRRIASYSEYTQKALEGLCASQEDLKTRWLRAEQRREIRDTLEDEGVDLSELAAALKVPEADARDLLLHVAFGQPINTRHERAGRLRLEHAAFFQRFDLQAREILNAVLDKYVAGEAQDIDDTELLKVPPLSDRGTFMELIRRFGGGHEARAALRELEALLYAN
jgi:type I restriction enzyme R subunit